MYIYLAFLCTSVRKCVFDHKGPAVCINILHTHRKAHIYTCCCVRNALFRMRRTSVGHTAESACDLKVFFLHLHNTTLTYYTTHQTHIHTHARATYDILFISKIADRAWPVSLSPCSWSWSWRPSRASLNERTYARTLGRAYKTAACRCCWMACLLASRAVRSGRFCLLLFHTSCGGTSAATRSALLHDAREPRARGPRDQFHMCTHTPILTCICMHVCARAIVREAHTGK